MNKDARDWAIEGERVSVQLPVFALLLVLVLKVYFPMFVAFLLHAVHWSTLLCGSEV